jgi:hypothetical protein
MFFPLITINDGSAIKRRYIVKTAIPDHQIWPTENIKESDAAQVKCLLL